MLEVGFSYRAMLQAIPVNGDIFVLAWVVRRWLDGETE